MQKIQTGAAGMRSLIHKRRAEIALFAVISLFILGNIIAVVRNNIPEWDESVYIGMGKYLFSLGKIGAWEMLRPLPMAVLIGALWKTGLNPIYAGKGLGILFAAANIFLAYRIGNEASGKRAGMAAAFILAVTPVFFRWAGYGMTEMPAVCCALLSCYMVIRKRMFWAGSLAAAAFLFKFPAGIFLAALGLSLIIKRETRKSIIPMAAGFLVTIVPFLVFNFVMYGGQVSPLVAMLRPLLLGANEQTNPFYPGGLLFYFKGLVSTSPLLVLAPLGAFFLLKKRNVQNILISVYPLIALAYFSIAVSIKDIRFAILFLPFLAVLAGVCADRILMNKKLKYALLILGIILATRASVYDLAKSNKFSHADESLIEFYSYLQGYPQQGVVLSNIPYPLAYLDEKLKLVFYVNENPDKVLDGVSSVIYVPSAVKCRPEDEMCIERKEMLMEEITENWAPVTSKEINGEKAQIYITA